MTPMSPLDTRPDSVIILAYGPSVIAYAPMMIENLEKFDEVWAVTRAGLVFQHDKLFYMDNLEEMSRQGNPMAERLTSVKTPIITSTAYSNWPNTIEYPIKEVVEYLKCDFMANTICYAIAYAIYIHVKEITLYGCDFSFPDKGLKEPGSQAAAYLLGLARGQEIKVTISPHSSLLYTNQLQKLNHDPLGRDFGFPLYGFKDYYERKD